MQSEKRDQTKGQILIAIKDISRYTPLKRILLTSIQFLSTKCHKHQTEEKLRLLQESYNEHSTQLRKQGACQIKEELQLEKYEIKCERIHHQSRIRRKKL